MGLREFEEPFVRNRGCTFRGEKEFHKNHQIVCLNFLSSPLIAGLLQTVEPEAVANRRQQGFQRRHFWAAGVNDVWPQDQHDKWGHFGL